MLCSTPVGVTHILPIFAHAEVVKWVKRLTAHTDVAIIATVRSSCAGGLTAGDALLFLCYVLRGFVVMRCRPVVAEFHPTARVETDAQRQVRQERAIHPL